MSGWIVKAVIEDAKPPVWRRIVIPEKINFKDLHIIMQEAFGWEDLHMHEFAAPGNSLFITSGEDENDMFFASQKTKKETALLVDDIFKKYKWVRYTYDFGDEWNHKITIEKQDPEYKERYALVLKAKGDNFEEDCGGVYAAMSSEEAWKEEEAEDEWDESPVYRPPFSMEQVNERLKNHKFPVRKSSKSSTEDWWEEKWDNADFKQLTKMFNQMFKANEMMKKSQKLKKAESSKPETPSKMTKAIEKWKQFWETYGASEHDKSGKESEQQPEIYQQMTLPLEGLKKEPEYTGLDHFLRSEKKASLRAILDQLGAQQVQDYYKYLNIEKKAANKKERIDQIAAVLLDHWEYCLYVVDQEGFSSLKEIYQCRPGAIHCSIDDIGVYAGMQVGLLECRIKKQGVCEIVFSELADVLFTQAKGSRVKNVYQKLYSNVLQIKSFLQVYGAMEIQVLYDFICEKYKSSLSFCDFQRIVYWHCRMSGLFTTAVNVYTQEAVVIGNSVRLDENMVIRDLDMEELTYKNLNLEELKNLQKAFNLVYPCWEDMMKYLIEFGHMDEENVICVLDSLLRDVQGGLGMTEIVEEIMPYCTLEQISDYIFLWNIVLIVMMETPLTALKGYSRHEVLQMEIDLPPQIQVQQKEKNGKITKKMHLYEMPDAVQEIIYEVQVDDSEDTAAVIQSLCSTKFGQNEELRTLLIMEQKVSGQYDAAKASAQKLLQSTAQKNRAFFQNIIKNIEHQQEMAEQSPDPFPDFDEWLNEYGDRLQPTEKIVPFRRENKKIGRNDPCPCGSGKKYKHCCGKNK